MDEKGAPLLHTIAIYPHRQQRLAYMRRSLGPSARLAEEESQLLAVPSHTHSWITIKGQRIQRKFIIIIHG
jgi:hypothetical protein